MEAVVLHATRSQGLVEVSCKDDLVAAAKERGEGSGKKGKKRKVPADSPALEIGEKLAVRVELVKKGHAVVSTEVGRRVAMGATCNLNTMGSERQMKLAAGDVVEAEVVAEECAVTYGRAVVALTKKREEKEGERKGRAEKEKKEGKKAKKEEPAEDAGAGEVVTVTVMMVHPTQVEVKLPSGQVGRIHGSEVS